MRDDFDVAFEQFERADYPRILEVMEDRRRMPPDFDSWERHAEAGVRALEANNFIVVRTLLKSDDFSAWCKDHGLNANAQARLKYCRGRYGRPTETAAAVNVMPNPPAATEPADSKPAPPVGAKSVEPQADQPPGVLGQIANAVKRIIN